MQQKGALNRGELALVWRGLTEFGDLDLPKLKRTDIARHSSSPSLKNFRDGDEGMSCPKKRVLFVMSQLTETEHAFMPR